MPSLFLPEGNERLQNMYPYKTLHMTPLCLGDAYIVNTLWVAWYLIYLWEGNSKHRENYSLTEIFLSKRQPLQM